MHSSSMLAYVLERMPRGTRARNALADHLGISRSTLEKIALRKVPNPGVLTIQKLYDHFLALEDRARPFPHSIERDAHPAPSVPR